MICPRCHADAMRITAILGVTRDDRLIERWECLPCRQKMTAEYPVDDGPTEWTRVEHVWPRVKRSVN